MAKPVDPPPVDPTVQDPAVALSDAYEDLHHPTGVLFQNAVATQQDQHALEQAAANQGVMQIYGIDTTAAAAATEKLVQAGVADNLLSVVDVLKKD